MNKWNIFLRGQILATLEFEKGMPKKQIVDLLVRDGGFERGIKIRKVK